MRAHARVCVRAHVCCAVCVHVCVRVCGAGAHVCRDPSAVKECRAPGVVQECRDPGAGAHVCRAAGAGAAAGAGVGTGAGPPPLITVHPPTELYFRQSRATPEPQK